MLVNRFIPIGVMNNAQLNAEFAWIRDRLASDLINIGMISNLESPLDHMQAMAVAEAMLDDMIAAHPNFLPEGVVDPNAV